MTELADLVSAATAQLDNRPGSTVAAALRLADGTVLTSVALDNINAAATLCAETGALCQAHTLDRAVTASACVSRDVPGAAATVLAPCGICQERLALWGPDVRVAVGDGAGWAVRTLAELNPYYWARAFTADGAWPGVREHSG